MDKKALQSYATWSKQYLEQQIELSLKSLGIHSDDDIREAKRVGDVTIIDGDSVSYPAELKELRESIIKLIHTSGYQNTVETFAYTWFNRIIALRFMEVHEFLPHGFRVLSDRSGGVEPEILKNLSLVKTELSLDMLVCADYKDKNDIDGLFRYVLFKQCNALSNMLPMLFDKEDAYMELLLPKSLLKGDTIITKLRDIPENAFLDDIEIIGWLYQYYVSAKKDKVFADLKKNIKISADNIPAATQLFTPDWIVRYMAENSLGRIWMESYPNSSIKSKMNYYLNKTEYEIAPDCDISQIRYQNVNPQDLRVIEPCCGSGHILVYLFDLLFDMYEEKGYMPREIPTLILSNNLFGFEIDKRAAQLASFALVMRARSINNRFFDDEYYVRPNVYEIYSSKELLDIDYRQQLDETSLLPEERNAISSLVVLFKDAKSIGSLLDTSCLQFDMLERAMNKLHSEIITTFNLQLLHNGLSLLDKLFVQAKAMNQKFDVCVTNPPYMGSSGMNPVLTEYIKDNYFDYKSDLFAAFICRCSEYVKSRGFVGLFTPYVWMFIQSYEKLRHDLYSKRTIETLIQFEYSAFEEATVPICTFAYRNSHINKKGNYIRLTDFRGGMEIQRIKALEAISNSGCGFYYNAYTDDFSKIPGEPVAYWVSKRVFEIFEAPKLQKYTVSKCGMGTSDNERFLKLWYEINWFNIGFHYHSIEETTDCKYRWIPYNKGGAFRKWYGNREYVVNFFNNAEEIREATKNATGGRIVGTDYYFKKHISWSDITSGSIAYRAYEEGFIFDACANIAVMSDEYYYYVLGLVNTKFVNEWSKILNPTFHFKISNFQMIPAIIVNDEHVNNLVKENIELSRNDWDSFEISWDFEQHPFMKCTTSSEEDRIVVNTKGDSVGVPPIGYAYANWMFECEDRFNKLKDNEEELNRIFIDIYGLQGELIPDISDEDITVRKADLQRDIKSFISYLVGIVMGRYSLDVPGLAYAGGAWDSSKYKTYQPDDDGIVPIYVGVGMEDGLTGRITDLIKLIFGEESFRENMDFLAEGLGKANNESSVETLNRYLNDGFYADHLKIYQKRPIYWMFSSGKNRGFKCLVYMHRYNKDTLARINAKYYLPESTRQKIELEDLDNQIKVAEGKERIRLEKSRTKFFDKYNETIEYGQVLDHMANKYIDIDLDDGVKANYEKFQGVELVSDSGMKIKKDLLVPLK